MGDRWGPDGPPPEAYSRVTDPERFAPVVEAADALVARLQAEYDVEATSVTFDRTLRAVRLVPVVGAPLTVGVTDFPGVRLAFGHWCSTSAPMCGCDACDETAAEAIREMLRVVVDVVAGRFAERLTRLPSRLWVRTSTEHGWSALDRARYAELAAAAPPGEHTWPAWPRRSAT
jgi:hypothetical protein